MADGDLPPLVFIHGWKASVLADWRGEEKFNYSFAHLLGFGGDVLDLPMEWDANGRQAKDDLQATHPTFDVKCLCGTVTLAELYGPLIRHLGKTKGRDVRTFTYDWRRELDETSANFEKFLVEVKKETGLEPQVVAHSMGGLISLHVLNRRPEIFHSILFGAAALGPFFSVVEDMSLVGGVNAVSLNKKMFTPSQQLTNPAPVHLLASYAGEREAFGRENLVVLTDHMGRRVDVDLHSLESWRKHKMGMYHPDSGVDVTPAKEAWFQSVLDTCHAFRKGLIPELDESLYPPCAVLNSDGHPTRHAYHLNKEGHIDFANITFLPGDGRVLYEDAVPPKGIPVSMKITNKMEHSVVLNDLDAVDKLLAHLISVKSTQH